MDMCCEVMCRKFCTTDDGSTRRHGEQWRSADDACTTSLCHYGEIRNFTQLCSTLNCPVDFRYIPSGECCPRCDPSWATFCPEDEECEFVCQFGYEKDAARGCDRCKCARKDVTNPTTSTTMTTMSTTESVEISSPASAITDDDDVPRIESSDDVHHEYKNVWPMYDQQLLVFCFAALSTVLLVACILGIGFWCLSRRAYKPLPLLNSNSTGGSTA